jgi:hypothetical protein
MEDTLESGLERIFSIPRAHASAHGILEHCGAA